MRSDLLDELLAEVDNPNVMVRFIRLHQYLDGVVSALVNERLVESHYLDVERVPFSLRVELGVAIGVVANDDRSPLLQFNTIRNQFAHDPKKVLTEKDSRDFYNLCQGKLRQMANRKYESFADAAHCVTVMSLFLYLKLQQSLEQIRDSKLWDRASSEEMQDLLDKNPRLRDAMESKDTGADESIRARFDRLKAEEAALENTPKSQNAP
jgi:hypothetical protein